MARSAVFLSLLPIVALQLLGSRNGSSEVAAAPTPAAEAKPATTGDTRIRAVGVVDRRGNAIPIACWNPSKKLWTSGRACREALAGSSASAGGKQVVTSQRREVACHDDDLRDGRESTIGFAVGASAGTIVLWPPETQFRAVGLVDEPLAAELIGSGLEHRAKDFFKNLELTRVVQRVAGRLDSDADEDTLYLVKTVTKLGHEKAIDLSGTVLILRDGAGRTGIVSSFSQTYRSYGRLAGLTDLDGDGVSEFWTDSTVDFSGEDRREWRGKIAAQSTFMLERGTYDTRHIGAGLDCKASPPLAFEKGAEVASFVPAKWKIGQQVRADLNGDKKEDFVLVLGDGVDTRLLVLFTQAGGGLMQVGVTDVNTINALEVKKNVVSFTVFGGGTQLGTTELFRMRWDANSGRMRVIGADYSQENIGRGSSETYETSTNFVTGLRMRTDWEVVDDVNTKVETRTDGEPQFWWLEDFAVIPVRGDE